MHYHIARDGHCEKEISARGNSCLLKRTKLSQLVERGFHLSVSSKILISFHKVELPQVGKEGWEALAN